MRLTVRIAALVLSLAAAGCGLNIFAPVASKSGDKYWMEEARVRIDDQDFSGALEALENVERDTNDLRLLRTAARLGASGLSLWNVIIDAIDNSSSSASGEGTDQVFNTISGTVVGEGETKTQRIAALSSAINDLLTAPDPSLANVKNLSCFLAAVLALPTSTDTTTAVTSTVSSLSDIAASTDVSNPNASCPSTNDLQSSLALMSEVQQRFALILSATASCKFIDTTGAGSQLNAIEATLQKFKSKADAGCSKTPACGSSEACKALGLGCVYTALTADKAISVAGDGVVSSCEMVQNCLDPTQCF